MVTTALLSSDLENGGQMLRLLDEAKVKVSVALWAILPEYTGWRMVISGRPLDQSGIREGYGVVNQALVAAGMPFHKTPDFMILKMSDPSIRALRKIFAKSEDVEGTRLGGQMIGNRFIEDAYVYRIR